MWLFAYGSLIFRPDFAYLERRVAWMHGYARRFWQSSPDHRGTPDAPGLVATVIASPGAWCGGCAYRVDPAARDAILSALDHREQAGFARVQAPVHDRPSRPPFAEATVYVADGSNPHFTGPLAEREIAGIMATRRGPSGENVEYALALAEALAGLGIDDPHVAEVARHLRARHGA
jgi:glutathione-specific gamma-glutamylcyclotransferase